MGRRSGGGRIGTIGHAALVAGLLATTAIAATAIGVGTEALAQSGVQTSFNIPAGSLGSALAAFGSQSGTQVSYEASIVSGKTSVGLSGTATREQALAQLLQGSGLVYSFPDPASVLIYDPSGAVVTVDGAIALDTINVTAAGGVAGGGGGIDPYTTAAPVSSIGGEVLQQRFGGDANAALRATPGTFTRQGADQPGYAVNIRGMAGNGRVNSMIDGVPQTFRNAAGHAADNGTLLYVHPEFLSGIEITRGSVPGPHGAGTLLGAANFKTLTVDDILIPGQNLGTFTRLTAGTNGHNWSGLTAAAARNSLFPDGTGEVSVVAAWADSQATNHKNGEGVFLNPPVSNSPTGQLLKFSIARDLTTRVLIHDYRKHASRTLAAHGLVRRVTSLVRCMERVYNLVPLDAVNPPRPDIDEAAIFLQAFIINAYGAVDNLARIWVLETDLTKPNGGALPQKWIGLGAGCKLVRESLSQPFQEYLAAVDPWFEYLENYRHALAHRVPLYIPPKRFDEAAADRYHELENEQKVALRAHNFGKFGELQAEQMALGVFEPWMMHSYGPADDDGRPVRFHPQMICDLGTVVELSERMMTELEALPAAWSIQATARPSV